MAIRPRQRFSLCALLLACAILLVAALPAAASAPGGSLDATFGNGGFATLPVGTWGGAAAVALQRDGKIVTAGEATVAGHNVMFATRMRTDGALDPTFGSGGLVTVDIHGGGVVDSGAALAIQKDGKIVMVGAGVDGPYGPLQFAAVRLLQNGSPDPSFGSDGIAMAPVGKTSIATAVVIQSDGSIVLAGTALLEHNEFAVARLSPRGGLDKTFGNGGTTAFGPTAGIWGMALEPDGKLVVAGQADYSNPAVSGAQQFMTARLNTDGSLDGRFGRGGIVMTPVGATSLGFGVALQRDGKLVLAGPAFTNTGVNATVRLNADGTLDATYGVAGIATIPDWYGANGVILDPAGRVILPSVGASAVMLNADGTPDKAFGAGGIAMANSPTGGANGAAVQPDGKVVLAGAATVNGQTVLAVIRLTARAPQPVLPAARLPAVTTGATSPKALSRAVKANAMSITLAGRVTPKRGRRQVNFRHHSALHTKRLRRGSTPAGARRGRHHKSNPHLAPPRSGVVLAGSRTLDPRANPIARKAPHPLPRANDQAKQQRTAQKE